MRVLFLLCLGSDFDSPYLCVAARLQVRSAILRRCRVRNSCDSHANCVPGPAAQKTQVLRATLTSTGNAVVGMPIHVEDARRLQAVRLCHV